MGIAFDEFQGFGILATAIIDRRADAQPRYGLEGDVGLLASRSLSLAHHLYRIGPLPCRTWASAPSVVLAQALYFYWRGRPWSHHPHTNVEK